MPYTAAQLTTIYTNANDGLALDAATALLLQAYANQNSNGTLTDAQTLSTALHIHPSDASVINSPESTTDVAVATYQFFSGLGNGGQGTTVSQAGLNYLVNPATGGNPNALGGAYYAQFDQANRYINFAVNLGTGAGQYAASFAQAYGSLTFDQTVQTAYETIVGTPNVGAANAQAAIAAIEGQQAYFTQFVAEYAPGVNQDLALKAAVIGYILEESIKADVGTYATAVDAFDTQLGATGAAAFGGNLLAASNNGSATFVLTTGVDNITGNASSNTYEASLTPYLINGTGPTLNPGDTITGVDSNNTLVINDAASPGLTAVDTIPAGVTLTGIQHLVLDTANNAGAGSGSLDTTSISGLTDVTVNSGGAGADFVKAASSVAIIIDHSAPDTGGGGGLLGGEALAANPDATGVQTFGGSTVNVTAGSGSIIVGDLNAAGADPSAAVTIADQSTGDITVFGGTNVSVTTAGSTFQDASAAEGVATSYIQVGNNSPSTIAADPTGDVTIVDTGADTATPVAGGGDGGALLPAAQQSADIEVFGGHTVSITASGDSVLVGGISTDGVTSLNPTGDVSVANTAANPLRYSAISGAQSGFETDVTIGGGANVTVSNNAGSISVGESAVTDAGLPLSAPTGDVTVTQTTADPFVSTSVAGGVNVSVTAAGGDILVGAQGTYSDGSPAPLGVSPTGAVTIVDKASATVAAVAGQIIDAFGGASVSVTTNAASVQVGSDVLDANGVIEPGENTTGPVSVTDTTTKTVAVFGGSTVAVASSGGEVVIGETDLAGGPVNPTGAVTVTDSAARVLDGVLNTAAAPVFVAGGTSVTIVTNAGGVQVGDTAGGAGNEPTGAVAITSSAADGGNEGAQLISVSGGTTVNVVALGGAPVVVGDPGSAAANPSGAVTIGQSGVETGGQFASNVDVYGAPSVTIVTTGAGAGPAVNEGPATAGIVVGSANTPITGAVSITDTFVGANTDSVSVTGGSTVSVTTTATSGAITVGAAPVVTGGALSNASASPTGAVSIVSESMAGTSAAGAANVYGDGAVTVDTNGSTSVSIIGAGAVSVTDVQTAVSGTSTLSSVYLEGVFGAATLTSDALNTVSVVNAQAAVDLVIDETPAHALTATVTNAAPGGVVTLQDATATALTLNTGAGVAETVSLELAHATSATIVNAEALAVTVLTASPLASVTAFGSALLNLGDLTADGTLTTINASKSSGAVVVGLNPGVTNFSGGSGADYVEINSGTALTATGTTTQVQGGGAAGDTLIANFQGAAGALPLGLEFRDFNVLAVGDIFGAPGAVSNASGSFSAAGFSSLEVLGQTGAVTFTNATGPLMLAGSDNSTVSYELDSPVAFQGTLAITQGVQVATPISAVTGGIVDTVDLTGGGANTASISTITVASAGDGAGQNVLNLDDTLSTAAKHVSTLNVTGAEAITVNYTGTGLSVINASGATGAVNVGEVSTAAGGVTITGGTGLLTAHGSPAGSTTAIDGLTSGSGGSVFTLGYGGSWNAGLSEPNGKTGGYDSGRETVNLSASAAAVDTLNVASVANGGDGVISNNTGAGGGVTGFQAVASLASDLIRFNTGVETVLTNQGTPTIVGSLPNAHADAAVLDTSGNLGTALSSLTYTSSNGLITFGTTGTNNISQFNSNQLIDAAQIILKDSGQPNGGADSAALFVSGGNTYVVSSSGSSALSSAANPFNVMELNGQSDTGGFGYLGAANTVALTDPTDAANGGFVLGAQATHPGGAASEVYNDGGDSAEAGGAAYGTTSTTFNNLAASALVHLNDGVANEAVTITQVGAAGANSLVGVLGGAEALSSLTVTGDYVLELTTANGGGTDMIKSLVDSTNTLSALLITTPVGANADNVTIGAITSTALKVVDAHLLTGGLTLTANEAGLQIAGSQGANTIHASGAGDVITANLPTLTASGAGDTLTTTGSGAIHAGGAGDVITIGAGTVALDGGSPTTSLGAGDILHLAAGGNYTALLGASSTVDLGTAAAPFSGTASLTVTGDTAGATSAGAYHLTTVNGADTFSGGQLTLTFGQATTEAWAGGSATSSEVNTAGATSLAQALDLAVSQAAKLDFQLNGGANTSTATGALTINGHTGLVDWFQYQGNTYVVETVNGGAAGAAHTALAAGDVVVELSGLVSLVGGDNFNGHSVTVVDHPFAA